MHDPFAASIQQVLVEEGAKVLAQPDDYSARANVMWATTMALNGLISVGVPQDWASHMIGHELTALHGIDHARTLAVVVPSLMVVQKKQKWDKLLQFGARVWDLHEGSDESRVDSTIAHTRAWFESLGIATKLSDYVTPGDTATLVASRLAARGLTAIGERADITPEVVEAILVRAA